MDKQKTGALPAIFSIPRLIVALGILAAPGLCQALPQFSRQYDIKCSQCHLSPPTLNAAGRRYLANGYRFFREERDNKNIGDILKLDETIPLGIELSSRPYVNINGDEHSRLFHDARLYLGGGIYRDFSAFVRFNVDEDKDYRTTTELATVSYNPGELINLNLAWTSITYPDIYDTFHSSRQLTIKRNSVIDQRFGGTDNNGTLSSPRQGAYLWGRLQERLFYSVGYSGNADDTNVGDLSTFSGRLAYEVVPLHGYDSFNMTFGAFAMHGTHQDYRDLEYSRIAGDVQMDIPLIYTSIPGVIRLTSAYLSARDDQLSGGVAENDAWYLQGMFVSMSKGSPKLVPVVRWDNYTKNNGHDRFSEITVNATYYRVENFRAQVEYWTQVDAPQELDKDRSITFQLVFLY